MLSLRKNLHHNDNNKESLVEKRLACYNKETHVYKVRSFHREINTTLLTSFSMLHKKRFQELLNEKQTYLVKGGYADKESRPYYKYIAIIDYRIIDTCLWSMILMHFILIHQYTVHCTV